MPKPLREDATLDAFLRLTDACGIEGAVCFAPFPYQMDAPNAWLAAEIRGRAGLVGYGTLDPAQPPGDQVTAIADLGFRGVKLHPSAQRFALDGAWARAAYAALMEHRLIADFHTGIHWHRVADCDPRLYDDIAFSHPELRLVFEHVGGWHFFKPMVALISNYSPRLFAGIASVLDRDNQKYWYLGAAGLEDCRWQTGVDQMIYGLDFPYNGVEAVQRDLAVINGLGWPQEDVDKLLGGNLKRLLGEHTADDTK